MDAQFSSKELECICNSLIVNQLMSKCTTYKIGGPAKYFLNIDKVNDLVKVVEFFNHNKVEYFIVGGGSNLLVSDKGYDGFIIKFGENFNYINCDTNNKVYECGCATPLFKIVEKYIEDSNKGAEFLHGIPGTLGGAIKMNAGRKDLWISSIIDSIQIVDNKGKISIKDVNEIDWDYRYSSIKDDEIIISANLKFESSDNVEELKSKINELKEARKKAQPTDKLTCGSVFKNPKDCSAGKLIEEAGLKGTAVGDAQISEKHANFIVNNGDAKAQDVVDLILMVQKTVFEKYKVKLIPEVKFLGFDEECSLF